jgi:hypothetical protein
MSCKLLHQQRHGSITPNLRSYFFLKKIITTPRPVLAQGPNPSPLFFLFSLGWPNHPQWPKSLFFFFLSLWPLGWPIHPSQMEVARPPPRAMGWFGHPHLDLSHPNNFLFNFFLKKKNLKFENICVCVAVMSALMWRLTCHMGTCVAILRMLRVDDVEIH